ncbi:MAG TPA: hypothetical protein VKE95_19350 [Burkholderiales bacterium]|nr:hypothetical protein [Burkholderiales bacterium]
MTDLNTEVVIADPPPIALERSAPANTPAHLSTHDAAAVLRKLRQPQHNETGATGSERAPAAAPAETIDASADAIDDAAPATQDPGEKTETADPARSRESGEAPPIEPPRSWTKEDKELFASLPRATQERLAERERSRESDFLRRQNEAAEKLKGLSAKEQAVELARQHYEAALPQLFATLQSQQAGEFADIKSMADVERLAREDWPRYLLWDLQQKKIADVGAQLLAAQHRQAHEQLAQFTEFATREDDLFKEKAPDMADAAKAAELQSKALKVLHELGFDEEKELVPMWNGQKDAADRSAQPVRRKCSGGGQSQGFPPSAAKAGLERRPQRPYRLSMERS